MSKIEKELVDVTEVKAKRGEDRQDFLGRVMKAVAELNDKEWDDLSQDAQDWFNDAADAKNAKAKTIPDFPDAEADEEPEEEQEEKSTRRSSGKAKKAELEVGVVAKITNKRGKSFTGTVIELDDEIVVLKMGNGDEEEIDRSRIESFEIAGGAEKEAPEENEGPAEPKVGATVTVITKRGKEITGKVVEIDDEVIVLDVDGEDEEFNRDRVESIKVAGKAGKATKTAKEEPEEKEEKSTRRGATKSKDEEPEEDAGKKRSSNAAGVSVGTRIKEIIAENLDASEADIAKILKKEGIAFKENTLKLNYVDCHKFLDILKAKKMLKA